ncbi:MAG: hypothetical protein IT293_11415 [Deltaproteobacteria bacterium]|nr:hypothetical protein [Deltaproteobacteria bacterium]
MQTSRVVVAITGGLLLFLSFTPPATRTAEAQLIEVEGLYEGKWSCQGFSFSSGKFKSGNPHSFMVVYQDPDDPFLLAVHIDTPISPNGDFIYNGFLVPDGANLAMLNKQAEAGLLSCPSADEGEVVRAAFKVKPGTSKGSVKMMSIVQTIDEYDGPEVATCKYIYKRVSTDPIAVQPVPPCE